MTIGVALAWWRAQNPIVLIAADSRYSNRAVTLTDGGIKTYDIGPRLGMVSAGNAIPPITAAEIVRPLLDAHDRANIEPLSFFDSVRTLTFFLDRVATPSGLWGESVAVGFFRSGAPGLAHIVFEQDRSRVRFARPRPGGIVAIPLGQPLAKEMLLRGMCRALDERRSVLTAALALMHYMSRHEGSPFATIGGGLSLGVCSHAERFHWPAVDIDGRRYVRGLDVTTVFSGAWPKGERVQYDEPWCTSVDQSATETPFGDALIYPMDGAHFGTVELADFIAGDEPWLRHDDPRGF